MSRVPFFWIYCNCYHSVNQISSMMSLTMMGLNTGPLIHSLFHFALMELLVVLETLLVVLKITLVVSVVWGMVFLSQKEFSQSVTLFRWSYLYQKESSPKVVDSQKYFGAQNPDFLS